MLTTEGTTYLKQRQAFHSLSGITLQQIFLDFLNLYQLLYIYYINLLYQ